VATSVLDQTRSYLASHVALRWRFKPESTSYAGAEDYVLDRGTVFDAQTPLTAEEEAYIRDVIAGTRCDFLVRECFGNAQQLVLADMAFGDAILRYCEGYASGKVGFPVHHGWVTLNGKVIDMTWRRDHGPVDADSGTWENRVLGAAPPGWLYLGCDDFADAHGIQERIVESGYYASYLYPPQDASEATWDVTMRLYEQARLNPMPPEVEAMRSAMAQIRAQIEEGR
jgi:hypothetical protein